MSVHHVMKEPFDLFFVNCPSGTPWDAAKSCYAQMADIKKQYRDCVFRGVELDRLEAITRSFVDVDPPDAVVFAGDLEKALEYGDWPKVVMALRWKAMKRSFDTLPETANPSDLEATGREYPTIIRLGDGSFYCSRLPENDTRMNTSYEWTYGWFIPGDAKEALAAIFIICRPEDLGVAKKYFSRYSQALNESSPEVGSAGPA
jgi:hypothetical protein